MVMIAFTARTGGADSHTLWKACAILVPITLCYAVAYRSLGVRYRALVGIAALVVMAVLLWVFLGDDLHLNNFRFLVNPNVIEDLRGAATAGGQFPWVWTAFGNSLLLAGSQTIIVVTVSTLAAYYLSRFAFRGRSAFLQSLLVLQAFPAITPSPLPISIPYSSSRRRRTPASSAPAGMVMQFRLCRDRSGM